MFHHLHGEAHPRVQGSFSPQELAQVIDAHKGQLLPAEDFLDRALAGALDPEHRCLTFDDGLRCQWDLARPVLHAYNLTAFWFVPTAPLIGVQSRLEVWRWVRTVGYPSVEDFYIDFEVEALGVTGRLLPAAPEGYLAAHTYLSARDRDFRYWRDDVLFPGDYEAVMDRLTARLKPPPDLWLLPDHLRTLARERHVIGCHSHRHPTAMSKLTKEEQEVEYVTATWILHTITGRAPVTVSHPCNQVTHHGLATLKSLGYELGFNATPAAGPSLLQMGRIDAADVRP